jgi:hypothetical protein
MHREFLLGNLKDLENLDVDSRAMSDKSGVIA